MKDGPAPGYNYEQAQNVSRYCGSCQLLDDCEIDLIYYKTGIKPDEWDDTSCHRWIGGRIGV